jgi:lysophospholipase L1-like esterase
MQTESAPGPSGSRSRLLKASKIVVINIAIFVGLLLLLEGAVRIAFPEVQPLGESAELYVKNKYGPSQGYRENARGVSLDAAFVTGPRGRRIIPGEILPTASDQPTLLVIGDSVAVGFGVEAENAMPHVLDRRLHRYRVINGAITTQTSRDYANVLVELLPEIQPKGVIVGLCLNDFNAEYKFGEGQGRTVTPVPAWLQYFNDHIFDFNHVLRRYSRLYVWTKAQAFDNSANVFRVDRKLYLRPEAHDLIIEDLTRIKAVAQRYDAWVEFFIFPYEYQFRSPENPDLFPQQAIKANAAKAGITVYDLYPDVAHYLEESGESVKSLYLFADPMHFSPKGHELVARLIENRIASHLAPHQTAEAK